MVSDDLKTSDADLLASFLATRDDADFGRLVARHSAALARHAVKCTGNHAAAEDVTQATLIILSRRARAAHRVARRRDDVFPWLAKTCQFVAQNWRRSQARRARRERQAALPTDGTDLTRPIELAEMLVVSMRDLRRRERRLVELRFFDELSWNEVATRLSITPGAARKACEAAQVRLRESLHRRGITVAPAVLVSTLAYLAQPSKAAAPTASAFTLASTTLTMMKMKSAAIVSAVVLAGAAVFVPTVGLLAQDPSGSGTAVGQVAATKPAPVSVKPSAPFADVKPDQTVHDEIGEGYRLQLLYVDNDVEQWSATGELLGAAEYSDRSAFTKVYFRLLAPGVPIDEPLQEQRPDRMNGREMLLPENRTLVCPAPNPEAGERQTVYSVAPWSTLDSSLGKPLTIATGIGRWTTFSEYNNRGLNVVSTRFGELHFVPSTTQDKLAVTFFATAIPAPHRIVAIDNDGKQHFPVSTQSVGGVAGTTSTIEFDLAPEKFYRFELQVREPVQVKMKVPAEAGDPSGSVHVASQLELVPATWGGWSKQQTGN